MVQYVSSTSVSSIFRECKDLYDILLRPLPDACLMEEAQKCPWPWPKESACRFESRSSGDGARLLGAKRAPLAVKK